MLADKLFEWIGFLLTGSFDGVLVVVAGLSHVGDCTSTCVKSSGLVESRLDAAFTMGINGVRCKMAI